MEHKKKLKVALNKKRKELKRLTNRLAQVEACRSRSPTLVCTSLGTQEDPSISVVDFEPPDTQVVHRPTVGVVKIEKQSLTLCSVQRVGMCEQKVVSLLYTHHKQCHYIAVVLTSATLLLTQQPRLLLKWRKNVPEGEPNTCGAICSDKREWLLVAASGQHYGVRAYMCGPSGRLCAENTLSMFLDREPLSDLCVWSNHVCSFVVAVASGKNIFLWHLKLRTDKRGCERWCGDCVAHLSSSVTCNSLAGVEGTDMCVVWMTEPTLVVWEDHKKEEYPLACAPLDCSVTIVWARREESHTFVMLCLPGVCVVTVVKNGVRILNCVHMEKNFWHISFNNGLLHMLSEEELSVWRVGESEPYIQLEMSGCSVADCVWTNHSHLLVLSSSLLLYDFAGQ